MGAAAVSPTWGQDSEASPHHLNGKIQVLITHIQQESWHRAKLLLQDLKRERNSSLIAHLNKLVHLTSLQGGFAEANWVLDEFLSQGMVPDIITFNSLLSGCSSAVQAFQVWSTIQDRGLRPTKITFNGIISACIRDGDVLTAEGWFFVMPGSDVRPCAQSACALIRAYDATGQLEYAKEFVSSLVQRGLIHHKMLFESLLPLLCRSCTPTDAKWLHEIHQRHHRNHGLASSILASLKSAGLPQSWERLLQRAVKTGEIPDAQTYLAALQACGLKERVEGASAPRDWMCGVEEKDGKILFSF